MSSSPQSRRIYGVPLFRAWECLLFVPVRVYVPGRDLSILHITALGDRGWESRLGCLVMVVKSLSLVMSQPLARLEAVDNSLLFSHSFPSLSLPFSYILCLRVGLVGGASFVVKSLGWRVDSIVSDGIDVRKVAPGSPNCPFRLQAGLSLQLPCGRGKRFCLCLVPCFLFLLQGEIVG